MANNTIYIYVATLRSLGVHWARARMGKRADPVPWILSLQPFVFV